MSDHRVAEHPDAAELARAVADDVAAILSVAIERRGESLMFAPGGSTPRTSFALLAEAGLDWSRVTILPGDERVAPPQSGLSNFAEIRGAFAAGGAKLQPLTEEAADCQRAAQQAEDLLQSLPWPPDLVWLGLGEDGHIASIFPGDCGVGASDTDRRAACVVPDPLPPGAPVARVTLTMPAILSARAIVLAGTGQAKKALLEGRDPAAHGPALPVHQLLERATQPVFVHWSPT
ncbi:MAG TPA: 6-phosphogluconolactonase [Sphingomicrobium sp.]|nr:6-phosphogluconolactonase [Sphingomicrobium sp.]